MRYALVDGTGTVTNVIEWDGQAAYTPPAGSQLVPWADPAGVGSTWNGVQFTAPPAQVIQPQMVTTEQFTLALNDLNLLAAWQTALAAAKASDRARWALNGKGTLVPINNPVLLRIAAKGTFDLNAIYSKAATE